MKLTVRRFECLDSTNLYARENFYSLSNGVVILARTQSAGKGRRGRKWISPDEGNLYFSIVLKDDFPHTEQVNNITQVASIAVAQTLEFYGLFPSIKWPNDVLVSGKKVCGLLSESVIYRNQIQGAVLGIGLNVNMSLKTLKTIDQPATAMGIELKKNLDPEEVLAILLNHFSVCYACFQKKGFIGLKDHWIKYTKEWIGKKVRVENESIKKTGSILAFNENGTLKINFDDNVSTVYDGDIYIDK
ncbi:MAG: biotin--[acetyl-CoA-carboxylase] ligase [Candidatus Aureabacteria bacterium]|nr:biotin--[acetyl-CoA-carboxylase] ligase [Candidatus Auribacterota bacterium]